MDAHLRERLARRLKIVEGQVRGVQRLLDENAYCTEVLTQIAAIQQALRGVGKEVTRHHFATCVAEAIRCGDGDRHYDELMDIMFKLAR